MSKMMKPLTNWYGDMTMKLFKPQKQILHLLTNKDEAIESYKLLKAKREKEKLVK